MAVYQVTLGGTEATLEYEQAMVAADTATITLAPSVKVLKLTSTGGTVYARRGSAPVSTARVTLSTTQTKQFGKPKGKDGVWTVVLLCSTATTINGLTETDALVPEDAVDAGTSRQDVTTAGPYASVALLDMRSTPAIVSADSGTLGGP